MKVIAAFAAIALLVLPVYPHFVSPNEFSRWLTAASVVERGSLEVSEFARYLGPRFEDLAAIDGRIYSNKPPGLAFVALPGYLAARAFAGPLSFRPLLYAMRLVASSLPLILLALTFRAVSRRLGGGQRAGITIFILLFATPLFAYGLLLFSHALVAAALFGAWALLFPLRRGRWSEVFAGALIGLAVICETAAVFPAMVIALCAIERGDAGRIARVIAGGLPFAALYAMHNQAAFGGPFEVSHLHEKFGAFSQAAQEGFGWPSPSRAIALLLHPSKGLLILSPVLALAAIRLSSIRERLSGPAFVALCGAPVSALLFAASYVNWHGGWTVGPRYILAAVPFLLCPIACTRVTRTEAFLAGFSATAVVLTTLAFPFVPEDFPLPWGSFALPLFIRGLAAPSVAQTSGGMIGIVVGLLLVVAAAVAAFDRRQIWAVAIGVAVAMGAGAAAKEIYADRPLQRLERGYIEDVYFDRRGALELSAGGAERVPQGLLRRREYELRLPPAPWPSLLDGGSGR